MQNVVQFVERSPADLEKPRKLGVSLTAESFGDIPACRIDRVLGLVFCLEIRGEAWPWSELEYFNADLFSKLPHDQIGVVTRGCRAS